jgi:hypothetical protein
MTDAIEPAYLPCLLYRLASFERWVVIELHGLDRQARTTKDSGADCGLSGRRIREIEKQTRNVMIAMQTQLATDRFLPAHPTSFNLP